ncbi:ATP-binding protein [Nocardiopsis tropica]|uniref:ATP-binding protein n=1 Tax=Nocardiopsis tropica TaxID=109330 RepID=A0ABU7KND7_9ACTN|nr:ATP-binding protein [Nocardiopsis umidischolae]MEE2050647.1 ATP-binding protein [Nocardiopsis umidischolae]
MKCTATPPPTPRLAPPRRLITATPDHAGIIVGHNLGYVRHVRRWIGQSAHVVESLKQDLRTAASELVTNSLVYTRSGLPGGETTVELLYSPHSITLRVTDQGPLNPDKPTHPRIRETDHSLPGGRGLRLVDGLAEYWEWDTTPSNGVSVYAVFARSSFS